MRQILILLRKDFVRFFRDKTAVSLTFLVPAVLIYVFGNVFGLNRRDTGPAGIRLAVLNESEDPAARKLVEALQSESAFRVMLADTLPDRSEVPFTEERLRALMRQNAFQFAVVLPPDLIRKDGVGLRVKLLSNPRNEIETQTVNGLLQKTIFMSAPTLLGQSLQAQAKRVLGEPGFAGFNRSLATTIANAFGGSPEEIERNLAAGNFGLTNQTPSSATAAPGSTSPVSAAPPAGNLLATLVALETEQVIGRNVKSPEATRVVGGWAMMFLLFALSGSATAFFEEKKTGIFQRLLSAPVTPGHLLWSRLLFGIILGLVQLTALFFAGSVLYGIDVLGNLGNLVVVCVAAAAACTAFGLFIVSISPTSAAASGLAMFLILTMSACGGAWFPISLMPEFMQQVARFTIVYWAMEGFAQALWSRDSLLMILPTVAVLLGIATAVMSAAVWRFRRGRLFD